jgi:hypothetical protein
VDQAFSERYFPLGLLAILPGEPFLSEALYHDFGPDPQGSPGTVNIESQNDAYVLRPHRLESFEPSPLRFGIWLPGISFVRESSLGHPQF